MRQASRPPTVVHHPTQPARRFAKAFVNCEAIQWRAFHNPAARYPDTRDMRLVWRGPAPLVASIRSRGRTPATPSSELCARSRGMRVWRRRARTSVRAGRPNRSPRGRARAATIRLTAGGRPTWRRVLADHTLRFQSGGSDPRRTRGATPVEALADDRFGGLAGRERAIAWATSRSRPPPAPRYPFAMRADAAPRYHLLVFRKELALSTQAARLGHAPARSSVGSHSIRSPAA